MSNPLWRCRCRHCRRARKTAWADQRAGMTDPARVAEEAELVKALSTGYGEAVEDLLVDDRVSEPTTGGGRVSEPPPDTPIRSAPMGLGAYLRLRREDREVIRRLEEIAAEPGGWQAAHADGRLTLDERGLTVDLERTSNGQPERS